MTIGERICCLRKERKLKQSDLAKVLCVSPSTIGMYEQNRREPDIGTIVKIANCLDVGVEYLLGLDSKNKDELSEPDKALLEVGTYFQNQEKSTSMTEDVIIYHRDGKTVKRRFTKEQLALFHAMLDAIPDTETDL